MDLSNPSEVVLPYVSGAVLQVLARTDAPKSGRAVAATAGERVGYRRVSQVLAELVGAGVVLRESHPPAYLYRLNRDHVAAEPLLMLADLRGRLLSRITDAAENWTHVPEALWLFGSAARGEGTPESDIDLLVVRPSTVEGDDPTWREQLDGLAGRVGAWSGNDCQILEYESGEFAALVAADDPLVESLRREAIVVAGRPPLDVLRKVRVQR
jgi:hypothetical protein